MTAGIIDRAFELARTGEARNEVELHHKLTLEDFAPIQGCFDSAVMQRLLGARFKEAATRTAATKASGTSTSAGCKRTKASSR